MILNRLPHIAHRLLCIHKRLLEGSLLLLNADHDRQVVFLELDRVLDEESDRGGGVLGQGEGEEGYDEEGQAEGG